MMYGVRMKGGVFIYKITCSENGKYYVGSTYKTPEQRFKEHLGDLRLNRHNRKFQNAYNKYDEESLVLEVLGEYPLEYQYDIETSYLQFIKKTDRKNSLNVKFVGRGQEKGYRQTKEAKRKISKARKGIPRSEETKRKISKTSKGRTFSEEHKQKLSEAKKGKTTWSKGLKQKRHICPHCGLEGGGGAMKQWHFDNCKHKGKSE